MSAYTRQYTRLSKRQKQTRQRKIIFIWIAFVVLLLFVLIGCIWLITGNGVHHLLPFGILIFLMTLLCLAGRVLASEVPVKTETEERLLDFVAFCFGFALICGLLFMAAILLAVAPTGGS